MNAHGVIELRSGPNLLIRAVWYLLVGWWLTGLAMALAWIVAITIIGLPLAFFLINRIPTALTLRPRSERYNLVTDEYGVTRYERIQTEQSTFVVRLLYFVLLGWWLSLGWMIVAYVLMLTILGIPLGLMMANRLPYVLSLHRGYA